MFSFNSNKIKSLPESRFGRKPTPDKICFEIKNAPAEQYLAPVLIWELINITEHEYYEKLYINPNKDIVPKKADQADNIALTTIMGT